jgi:hypothetical protein
MSGWNRRPASKEMSSVGGHLLPPSIRASWLLACLLAGLILAPFNVSRGARTPDQQRTVGIRLALPLGESPSDELRRYESEDQTWLQGLPADWAEAPPREPATARLWIRKFLSIDPAKTQAISSRPVAIGRGARALASLLRDRWLARGFLAARVVEDDPHDNDRGDAVQALGVPAQRPPRAGRRFAVAPGPRFRWGRLNVGGETFPGRARLLRTHLPAMESPFDPREWESAISNLLVGAGELGHPFARWVVRDVTVDSLTAEVHLEAMLLPGPQAVIGPQTSDLPAGRGEHFLRRASGLQAGLAFRESDLRRARRRLQERGLYQWVGEPIVYRTEAAETVGIHWPVTLRKRANRLEVVLGLSRREQDQPSRVSGQVDLRLVNLAGTGRGLQAAWSDDGRDRSHLGITYLEPLAFGTPLDALLVVDHEVMQDQYTRFRTDMRWRLPVVAAWGIEVGVGWDRSTFPTGALEITRRLRARGAFRHQRIDLSLDGWDGTFAIETARRQATLRGDSSSVAPEPARGQDERQRLLEVDLTGEVWLSGVVSLAGRAAYRDVSSQSLDIPLSEQYRFGGANSVRGYREDEFHGRRIGYGTLELRLGRAYRSRLYTFWDVGYFEFSALAPTALDPVRRQERSGSVRGFGLGLQTPTGGGDISLAIGFPGSVDFDTAKLHVSLLGAF